MKVQSKNLILGSLVLNGLLSLSVRAEEPAYCQPQSFLGQEQSVNDWGLRNDHLFKIGHLNLAGLAVGFSLPNSVSNLAERLSSANKNDGYCTFYFNDSNPIAGNLFNWHNVGHPGREGGSVEDFATIFAAALNGSSNSMLNCAENKSYLALGCDGMKHRGPTLFAMLLAYSGCSVDNSLSIANGLWGLNGIPPETRRAIVERGAMMGAANSGIQQRLQKVLLGL
jgi:hypothetical protein